MPTCGEWSSEARVGHIKQGYATGNHPERDISLASAPVDAHGETMSARVCVSVTECLCGWEGAADTISASIWFVLMPDIQSAAWSEYNFMQEILQANTHTISSFPSEWYWCIHQPHTDCFPGDKCALLLLLTATPPPLDMFIVQDKQLNAADLKIVEHFTIHADLSVSVYLYLYSSLSHFSYQKPAEHLSSSKIIVTVRTCLIVPGMVG